jgi:membrane-bound metal-dependent hydrolase YbcI (DUF457 family)
MIVGHFFLAAALTGLIAHYRGLEAESCLKLALVAGTLALLPDLDVLYSMKEITALFTSGFYSFTDSFWTASETVHRGLTHSLATLVLTSAAAILYHRTRSKPLAGATVVLTALISLYLESILTAAIMGAFSLGTILIVDKMKGYSTENIITALTAGLIIHPFGDVFTGTPPNFLYPLDVQLLASRIALFEDPVLNFFLILTLEIAAIWAAVKMYSTVKSRSIPESLKPLLLIGVGYPVLGNLVNTPTMSTGYQFVFSVILLSFTAAYAVKIRNREKIDYFVLSVNFLTAMTLASLVYLIQYVL